MLTSMVDGAQGFPAHPSKSRVLLANQVGEGTIPPRTLQDVKSSTGDVVMLSSYSQALGISSDGEEIQQNTA
jgi:hypothetical protein